MTGEIVGDATTWLDKMHAICENLDAMSYVCRHYAVSLRNVGMEKLAGQMEYLADGMERDSGQLLLLINEKVSEQLKDANEFSATVFKAVVAGMQMQDDA